MFHLLRHALNGHNQFASGGLILMLLGGIGVFLRDLPERLWAGLLSQSTMMITVKDDDPAFGWVKEWFLEQGFLKRMRRLDLDTTLRGTELALIPGPGCHFFRYAGRPFWVWVHRSEETKGSSQRRVESLAFRTLGRNQQVLRRFVDSIVSCHHEKTRNASCLYVWEDYWTEVQAYVPRLLSSVILEAGEKDKVIYDLDRFRKSQPRYAQLGVPYHCGYLFYGPPGTGKTSLVSGLAARFGMSIYVINLIELNDRILKQAMNAEPGNSVVLFEDIDCMQTVNRKLGTAEKGRFAEGAYQPDGTARGQAGGVTLSGLLNVLDGFHAPENVVFVMTTNDIAALDDALLRPGRIDYRLMLGEARESQRIELYRRFFPGAPDAEVFAFARLHCGTTMAEFQGVLLGREQELQLQA